VSGPAYEWKLRELMAMRGMFSTSDLIEPLAQRGIDLSRSQVYRLVAETPERVQVSTLLALCDILGCQLTDIAVPAEDGTQRPRRRPARKKAAGGGDVPASPAVPPEFFRRP
jgi:DNA-binding Xre family transcriptional regulator